MQATLARRVIWLASAKALAFTLSFALPLILVRSLSQTEFGLYKQVFLLVSTAITILPLGFAMSAFYFLPRCGSEPGRVVFNIMLVHSMIGGLAGIALLVRPGLLEVIFGSHEPPFTPRAWRSSSFSRSRRPCSRSSRSPTARSRSPRA